MQLTVGLFCHVHVSLRFNWELSLKAKNLLPVRVDPNLKGLFMSREHTVSHQSCPPLKQVLENIAVCPYSFK